ncbi:MAG: TIGR01777 family oxidoreductase [Vampirovibrionales bacterium]
MSSLFFPRSTPHILVAGATGCVGTVLVQMLLQQGCRVTVLSRKCPDTSTNSEQKFSLSDNPLVRLISLGLISNLFSRYMGLPGSIAWNTANTLDAANQAGYLRSGMPKELDPFVDDTLDTVRYRTWNPEERLLDPALLEEVDAVINLSGENIAQGRWTPEKKKRLLRSRVDSTALLAQAFETLAQQGKPYPNVWVNASAIGYYGSRGDDVMTEASTKGQDFLADICQQWEDATQVAQQRGVRVVHARIGVVLATHGGALHKMLLPFKLGAGSPLGDGTQWMSWVSVTDVANALWHCVVTPSLEGAVNCVSPHPVVNRAFSKTLCQALHRPMIAPSVPAFVLILLLGEMAEALLLSSTRVIPDKLTQTGFVFEHPTLEEALTALLS